MHHKYQKGEKAERIILEDLVDGAKKKKLLVVVDMFMGVGDRAAAWLEMFKDKATGSSGQAPLVFYHGTEPRDHFFAVAKTRLISKTMAQFQSERLAVPGYTAMPTVPLAWAGKAPRAVKNQPQAQSRW